MPICVLKRRDWCDLMSSCENEARFLHQNEVNLCDRETFNLDLFRMHLHRQPNPNTKLDLWSPIVSSARLFLIPSVADIILNSLPHLQLSQNQMNATPSNTIFTMYMHQSSPLKEQVQV